MKRHIVTVALSEDRKDWAINLARRMQGEYGSRAVTLDLDVDTPQAPLYLSAEEEEALRAIVETITAAAARGEKSVTISLDNLAGEASKEEATK